MTAITDKVNLDQHGAVAVLTVDNPPVNALSHGVRLGLRDGVKAALDDDAVKAVVITCAGRTFIAGADITEFGKPMQDPGLTEVLDLMENSSKPVIAAIHGTALGGGLEVTLACHYRVGLASARFGLPEVKLGLLPGAGGTQRLPRVVGVEKALDMIVGGNPIGGKDALAAGLADQLIDGDLTDGAVAFAEQVVAEGRPLKKIRDLTDKIDAARGKPEVFENFRKSVARKTRGFEAPESCIQCIEAAVNLPFDEGIKRERELFTALMTGDQSKAQRHIFFAEREAAKIPDVPRDTPTIDINSAAVLGAGTMGGGIAMNFLNAGIPVTLIERDQESLDRGIGIIRKNYENTASKGRITQQQVEERMALIGQGLALSDAADADIVIEAVFEDMDLKKQVFAQLDQVCKSGAILATNTSTLDVDEIASATNRPESVIGLHFFSPANVMRLLEEVRGEKTSKSVIATSMNLGKRIAKVPVLVGVCYGFVGNRMLHQRAREAEALMYEGALPQQVDKVLFDFGFPMGPFAMSDLAGLDVGWRIRKMRGTTSPVADRLCEMDRFGQKSSAGYYKYEAGSRAAIPDPIVEEIILEESKKMGVERRQISDEEILDRCLLPMINEGAKILEEGKAIRASDVDVIWVYGYGWPVYQGGPMFYADLMGLDRVLARLKEFQAQHGDVWKPADLIVKLAAEGKGFGDL